MSNSLSTNFDSVVMLTLSDWKTEPVSNRYHYATRFARHLPVYFVQQTTPDLGLGADGCAEEVSDAKNITLWHVGPQFHTLEPAAQKAILMRKFEECGIKRPLIWIYNPHLGPLIELLSGYFRVFHATEDYFDATLHRYGEWFRISLRSMLKHVELLVSVSAGVEQNYVERGEFNGPALLLENGCDYQFYASKPETFEPRISGKVAFYQGGLNPRIDFALLAEVVDLLPDWQFHFCGVEVPDQPVWEALKQHERVTYWGKLSIAGIRNLAHQATVGLIPFVGEPGLRASHPLKAYEYVACGLPVVSTPIDAFGSNSQFSFAETAVAFAEKIKESAAGRFDPVQLADRANQAQSKDYETNFSRLIATIEATRLSVTRLPKNILVLYDVNSTYTATVKEYLDIFSKYSNNKIYYMPATGDAPCSFDPNWFDIVVLHYSVRLSIPDHLSPHVRSKIKQFQGPKLLFIQDEYDTTETTRNNIRDLGIHFVFTCVPDEYRERVYPSADLPGVRFRQVLTGYVPERFLERHIPPVEKRTTLIGYRGRPLPFWYGRLGQEKWEIGKKLKAVCEARNIAADIEWTEEGRIYGPAWYDFICNCRVMLGTESGSNLFDDHGDIRKNIELAIAAQPELTFAEAEQSIFPDREVDGMMNQISPKMFEAIAFRTGLVLYEGRYSGILLPDVHFIPLKKDLSNIDEVLSKIDDASYIRSLTEKAYQDVIESGKYSYRSFVEEFDGVVEEFGVIPKKTSFITALIGVEDSKATHSFGVLVGIDRHQELKNYRFVQSAKYLPGDKVLGPNFIDELPEIVNPIDVVHVPVPYNVNDILAATSNKALVWQLLSRQWCRIPLSVRAVLKPTLFPFKMLVRTLWR